jgi:2-(1,2-epoxy-1,2-dihydrophenyl)acetyl-CoA isomerase
MSDYLLVERREGYHRLTLNRPEKMNALTAEMLEALHSALDAAALDPTCRAVLLTGAGRGFCAGQDLSALLTEAGTLQDPVPLIERLYNPLVRRLRSLPLPVVCAVNGIAAGAGASLALACDIVLAARSAKFIQAFVKSALIPDTGATFFLPRLVGAARARALTMLGEPVSAEQAEAWGMIWRAVEDDKLASEAEALAAALAKQATEAIAMIKQALEASNTANLESQLALERDLQQKAARTPDCAEGIRAFLEKRAPQFKGRQTQ